MDTQASSNENTSIKIDNRIAIPVLIVLFAIVVYFLGVYLPIGDDWRMTISKLDFFRPYSLQSEDGRFGWRAFPWGLFFIPHAWLPVRLGNAINFLINVAVPLIVIRKLTGRFPKKRLAMIYSSPFFLQLVLTNNIDWVPLLAWIVPIPIAVIAMSVKPQAVSGALLIWLKRLHEKNGATGVGYAVFPLAAVFLVSLAIWPTWMIDMLESTKHVYQGVNLSPFPFAIPVGIVLLWRAWKKDDAELAAVATSCFFPYVTPYSFTAPFVLLMSKRPREATIVWVVVWWIVIGTLI